MAAPPTPHVDIHRGGDRLKTRLSWLDSKHSFSFGDHYDPDNTHHGLLLVNNDDTVAPEQGFDMHPHRDMEIVTWVLSGSLAHKDSMGNSGVVVPGLAQRMSAGTGVLHAERNETATEPVHFVQMWVVPEEPGLTPGYQQQEIGAELDSGRLVTVASGMARDRDTAAIGINNSRAAFHVARVVPGQPIELPSAPFLHIFLARGDVRMEGVGELYEGDAVRLSDSGSQRVETDIPAEVLVWEMHAQLGWSE